MESDRPPGLPPPSIGSQRDAAELAALLRPSYSVTAKVGIGFLVFGVLLDAQGVSSFVAMQHSSGQGGMGHGIFGIGCFLFGAMCFGLGGLVAGVASRWRRGGERTVGLACLGLMLLGFFVGVALF